MLRGGGDDGSEPEMCQRGDEHLEGRNVYVITWASALLRCVRVVLGKRTARSVSPVSLGYTNPTAPHPHRWPSQLPTVIETKCLRIMSFQD